MHCCQQSFTDAWHCDRCIFKPSLAANSASMSAQQQFHKLWILRWNPVPLSGQQSLTAIAAPMCRHNNNIWRRILPLCRHNNNHWQWILSLCRQNKNLCQRILRVCQHNSISRWILHPCRHNTNLWQWILRLCQHNNVCRWILRPCRQNNLEQWSNPAPVNVGTTTISSGESCRCVGTTTISETVRDSESCPFSESEPSASLTANLAPLSALSFVHKARYLFQLSSYWWSREEVWRTRFPNWMTWCARIV